MLAPKVKKNVVINSVLTFAYFFAGGVTALAFHDGKGEVSVAALLPVVAGAARAAIGVWRAKRGKTLPMDS